MSTEHLRITLGIIIYTVLCAVFFKFVVDAIRKQKLLKKDVITERPKVMPAPQSIKQGTFPNQYIPPPPPPERPKQPEQDSCFWEIFQNGENIAKIRGILILDLNLTPLRIVDENQREKVLVFLPKDCVLVLSFKQ